MIFSFTNQKGGVGKTTTAINLGAYCAIKGKKVCLVDLDPQANLTSGLGLKNTKQKQETIYEVLTGKVQPSEIIKKTKIPNLSLIPSGIELAGSEVELVNMVARETILKTALSSLKKQFDYVFIDCPPSLGLLTINALTASNAVLIPVQTEYYALEGLGQLLNTIKLVKLKLNSQLTIGGVILTMYDSRTNLSKEVKIEIEKIFGQKVFKTVVPRSIRLSEAPSHGKSIYEYEPNSKGSLAYEKIADELIERF